MTDVPAPPPEDLPALDAFGRPFPTPEHAARYAARLAWEQAGVDPFGGPFAATVLAGTIHEAFEAWDGKSVRLAGRVTAKRGQGKAVFIDLRDRSGKIQLYANIDHLGEEVIRRLARWVHQGDFLGVEGTVFKTRMGEVSIQASGITMLSKALSPMPEKWHGLQDVEIRSRKRYLDLIANPRSKEVAYLRTKIISTIRKFLISRDYVEIETPVLTDVASGAAARPFNTHHNALDWDLHLRISLELPLKKAMIGGIDRVFEIGRVFRNEGIDRDHNPEFTMLELYEAFSDYEGMMEITESMFAAVAEECLGSLSITVGPDKTAINLAPPWPRHRFCDLLRQKTGLDLTPETTVEELVALIRAHGLDDEGVATKGRALDLLFSKLVEDDLTGPVFVCDYPIELSPLAKQIPGQPHLTYRFEAYLCGMEMGNAFSELNDPEEQRRRFTQQAAERAAGDDEAMPIDEDFLEAMSHGMPPAGGLGIGIDRMVMVLAGEENLREIILFPLMRDRDEPEEVATGATFFQLIETAMATRGISPGKLMKECEVPKSDFNGWRKGERVPTPEQITALATYLGLPVERLKASAG